MKAIFKKELRSFFLSMTGYALIAFLITFVGIYFMIYNIGYGYPYFAYTLSGVMLILLVLVPVITMRSFAEEKKNRTDQLLFTSPIKIRDIVLGKYAAMVSVFFVPNVVFCLFPLIIKTMGNSSLLSDYVSLMEFFLMGCAFIAIGMFFSSVTKSPMIAAVITFAVTLILYIWDTLIGYLPSSAFANLAVLIVIVICGALLLHHVNKNKYLSIGLAAVAVSLLAVYLGVSIYSDWKAEKEAEKEAAELQVTDIDSQDIVKLSYTDGEESFSFTKEDDDTWYYDGDDQLPLDQSTVTNALDSYSDLSGTRKLKKADVDEAYGLDSPAYTIAMEDSEGNVTEINIGDMTGEEYYITADGGETVVSITGPMKTNWLSTAWMDHREKK